MKKIVALLISVLMILSMAAVAEEASDPALVIRISDIVIENTANDQTQSVNLDGFEGYLSVDTSDGLALVAQAFNGDESLALAVMKVVGSQLQVAIDGMDKTFAQDVPQLEGQDTSTLGETIRPMLPGLINLSLPPIQVGSLPKMDLTGLASMLGAEAAGDTTTFSVPSEIIDALLDQIIETAKTAGASVPGADQLFAMIEQLRSSGFSFSLAGQIVDSADQQVTTVEVYLVTDGQATESPLIVLTLTSAQDALNLKADIPDGEESMTIANLDLQTNDNAFLGTLDIAGMMQFNVTAFQEDGLQKAALTMESSMGTPGLAVSLAYGNDGSADVCEITFNADEDVAMDLFTSFTPAEDSTEGLFDLTVVTGDSTVHATANIEKFLGSLDLGDFTMPTDIAPMDDLQNAENDEALQTALMPLLQYLSQVVPADVAA